MAEHSGLEAVGGHGVGAQGHGDGDGEDSLLQPVLQAGEGRGSQFAVDAAPRGGMRHPELELSPIRSHAAPTELDGLHGQMGAGGADDSGMEATPIHPSAGSRDGGTVGHEVLVDVHGDGLEDGSPTAAVSPASTARRLDFGAGTGQQDLDSASKTAPRIGRAELLPTADASVSNAAPAAKERSTAPSGRTFRTRGGIQVTVQSDTSDAEVVVEEPAPDLAAHAVANRHARRRSESHVNNHAQRARPASPQLAPATAEDTSATGLAFASPASERRATPRVSKSREMESRRGIAPPSLPSDGSRSHAGGRHHRQAASGQSRNRSTSADGARVHHARVQPSS